MKLSKKENQNNEDSQENYKNKKTEQQQQKPTDSFFGKFPFFFPNKLKTLNKWF